MPFKLFKDIEYTVCSFSVEDGDTIKVSVEKDYSHKKGHRIRLHGIDAPEYGQQQMYYKSRSKLKRLCERAESLTVFITDEKDQHGRAVGILYGHHKNPKQKLDINRIMVRDGFAYAYAYDGNDPYRQEDDFAKLKGSGIRQELDKDVLPWNYRNEQKGKPKEPYYRRFLRRGKK